MKNNSTLVNGLHKLGLSISKEQIDMFEKYKELIKDWNKKVNITSITEDQDIYIKHFLDSATIFKTELIKDGIDIIDIGTGGGFPGLPIKIINPRTNVTLLDSLNKRIIFLNDVIDKIGLTSVFAVHGRAEEFGKMSEYREKFDISVSRAVAPLNILCEYCLPFVKVGGYFIAMKSINTDDELKQANNAIKILGGVLTDSLDILIPNTDIKHRLIIIKKIRQTSTKYPRSSGKPKKKPL